MKLRLLNAACLVFGSLVSSPANSMTSAELLSNCKSALRVIEGTGIDVDGVPTGMCIGYVAGVLDGYEVGDETAKIKIKEYYPEFKGPKANFKVPDGADPQQIIRVVVKYLEDHPENLHQPAWFGIIMAATNAFPIGK